MTTYVRVIDGDGEEYLTTRKELSDEIVAMQNEGFDAEIAIVKEANSIEELCDSYVLCDVAEGQPIVGDLANDKHRFELVTASLHDLYLSKRITKKDYWLKLAIWTDKGLIYVAELNEKGNLELL